jgi:aryl-alcohol dehydrogenase-like predicted oxidoreductase
MTVASKWGYTYAAGWSTTAEQHEVKDHSLASFERQLSESVERLGRHLSLYQIHSVTAESETLEDNALIDAIARMRERGIRAGLSVSGAGQDIAICRALEVRRDGERVFDSVQATWNLLERGAERALEEAHAAGMKVVVKESLANGRLTYGNQENDAVFAPRVAKIRKVAESQGTTIEMLALAAVLARPWVTVVLTGAATVDQVRSTMSALDVTYDRELDDELRSVAVRPDEYWRVRSRFTWN